MKFIIKTIDRDQLFINKPFNIYLYYPFFDKYDIFIKGPGQIEYLITKHSSCITQITCLCHIAGIYKLKIKSNSKNLNEISHLFDVKNVPSHYFNGLTFPNECLINTNHSIVISSFHLVNFFYGNENNHATQIEWDSNAILSAYIVNSYKINEHIPVHISNIESNYKFSADITYPGLHAICIRTSFDGKNFIDLKAIPFVAKSSINNIYLNSPLQVAFPYDKDVCIYGDDPKKNNIEIICIKDITYSLYGFVQMYSFVPTIPGIYTLNFVKSYIHQTNYLSISPDFYPEVILDDLESICLRGCVKSSPFKVSIIVTNIEKLQDYSTMLDTLMKLTLKNFKSKKEFDIYGVYEGNGIFSFAILCDEIGDYESKLYFNCLNIKKMYFSCYCSDYNNIFCHSSQDHDNVSGYFQVFLDYRCSKKQSNLTIFIDGKKKLKFYVQYVYDKIACISIFPKYAGAYTLHYYINAREVSSSPLKINVKFPIIFASKYDCPIYGIGPTVGSNYHFDFSLNIGFGAISNFLQLAKVFDDSHIQSSIINIKDKSYDWLKITNKLNQEYCFSKSGIYVTESIIKTKYGVITFIPKIFIVSDVPKIMYEDESIILIKKSPCLKEDSIECLDELGNNIITILSEEEFPFPCFKLIVQPVIFGEHKITYVQTYGLFVLFPISIKIIDPVFFLSNFSQNQEFSFYLDAMEYETALYNRCPCNPIKNIIKSRMSSPGIKKNLSFGALSFNNGLYLITARILDTKSKTNTMEVFYSEKIFLTTNLNICAPVQHIPYIYAKNEIHYKNNISVFIIDFRMFSNLNKELSLLINLKNSKRTIPYYIKSYLEGICCLYIFNKYEGTYLITFLNMHQFQNNSLLCKPYTFQVEKTSKTSKPKQEDPLILTKKFKLQLPVGTNTFKLIQINIGLNQQLKCSLIDTSTQKSCCHPNPVHIESNKFKTTLKIEKNGFYMLDMYLVSETSRLELYAIPIVVFQIKEKFQSQKYQSIKQNLISSSYDRNWTDEVEIIMMESVKEQKCNDISETNTFVNLDMLSNIRNNKYMINSVSTLESYYNEQFKCIIENDDIKVVDLEYIIDHGVYHKSNYMLWLDITKLAKNKKYDLNNFTLNILGKSSSNIISLKCYYQHFFAYVNICAETLGELRMNLMFKNHDIIWSYKICSSSKEEIRIIQDENNKLIVNHPNGILFDLRKTTLDSFVVNIKYDKKKGSIEYQVLKFTNQFYYLVLLAKAPGLYTIEYGKDNGSKKSLQIFIAEGIGGKNYILNEANVAIFPIRILCVDNKAITKILPKIINIDYINSVIYNVKSNMVENVNVSLDECESKVRYEFLPKNTGVYIIKTEIKFKCQEKVEQLFPAMILVEEKQIMKENTLNFTLEF